MSPRRCALLGFHFVVCLLACLLASSSVAQVVGGAGAGAGARVGLGGTSTSVTTMDGYDGYFFAGVWRPFVVGAIPVVGDAPGLAPSQLPKPSTRTALEDRISRLNRGERPTPRVAVSQHKPSVNGAAASSSASSTASSSATPAARLGSAAESSAGQGAPSLRELRRKRRAP